MNKKGKSDEEKIKECINIYTVYFNDYILYCINEDITCRTI